MDYLQQFDGKALLICIFAWAALFNAIRAVRWKRAYMDAETAYTSLAQENIKLRSLRQEHRHIESFVYPSALK